MPPAIVVTIGSDELSLRPGGLDDLKAALRRLPREEVLLRTISVLHSLDADKPNRLRTVNASYLAATARTPEIASRLGPALTEDNTTFFTGWQQLVILRQAMAVCVHETDCHIDSEEGFRTYFDVCRLAADAIRIEYKEDPADGTVEKWLKVAAGFMPHLWLSNAPHPTHWIGRMNLMMERVPKQEPALQKYVDALKGRFPEATGLSYDELMVLTQFLGYWSLRLETSDAIFRDPAKVRLNPKTWLKDTKIPPDSLAKLLERIARPWDEVISDASLGGPVSILPFRDRPFLQFQDHTVAPVMREMLVEKMTSDVFWWLKRPDVPQDVLWQQSWGYVAEGYLRWILARMAAEHGCGYRPDIKWEGGQVDAAMWFKGHVALFEITASSLSDAAGNMGDWQALGRGLHQAFVESQRPGKPPKREAILQLANDIKALEKGLLGGDIPVTQIDRVYPVMLALDRRWRTPGVWRYLDSELRKAIWDVKLPVAPLVPLAMEDLESIDELLRDRPDEFSKTPRGLLKVLRRWDVGHSVAPSWWQFEEVEYGTVPLNRYVVQAAAEWREKMPAYFESLD